MVVLPLQRAASFSDRGAAPVVRSGALAPALGALPGPRSLLGAVAPLPAARAHLLGPSPSS
eukprot:7578931-Pyramimonas_sp.AAC.1